MCSIRLAVSCTYCIGVMCWSEQVLCVLEHTQSWSLCVFIYLPSPEQLVCFGNYPVLCTLCLVTSSQYCALAVFIWLASPVHSVCSNTLPVLTTVCVCMYFVQSCVLCVFINLSSPVHSVCSCTCPVLFTLGFPIPCQSWAMCVLNQAYNIRYLLYWNDVLDCIHTLCAVWCTVLGLIYYGMISWSEGWSSHGEMESRI